MPDLFTGDEARAFLDEIERLSADPAVAALDEAIAEPRSQAVRSIFRVHELGETVARLVHDARVVDVARQILGSEVYVHQSRATMKPGFACKEFYWNSAFATWHVENRKTSVEGTGVS